MVTVPVKSKELPQFVKDKLRTHFQLKSNPEFAENLRRLVNHPDWKLMLKYNPIRSEHEMKWYLESRFPGRKVELLNVGWNARIIAFDSSFHRGKSIRRSGSADGLRERSRDDRSR